MLKRLLTILILLKMAMEECLEGCIKCNTRDECEFCDGTNNYILDSITCKKITLDNCLTISTTGNCLVCSEGFYIDKTTQQCVELDKEKLISGCVSYESQEICTTCDSKNYIKEGKCEAIAVPVDKCLLADSAELTKCLECEEGYILNLDRKSCLKVTASENCAAYTTLNCSECKDGYVKEFNMYVEDIYKFEDDSLKFNVLTSLLEDKRALIDQGVYRMCKEIESPGCAEIITFDKCKECSAEFYLDADQKCIAYPFPKIEHCVKYESAQNCIECTENRYLKDGVCEVVEDIENCAVYSTTATDTVCTLCKDGFFVRNNGCVERTADSTFDACKEPSPDSDTCKTCQDGQLPTSDGFACLAVIENCLEYGTVDRNADKHLCDRCVDGMYWKSDEQKCTSGSTPNCERFEATKATCIKCKNEFFLTDADLCSAHDNLYGCVTYSPTVNKTCSVCHEKAMLFTRNNGCVYRNEPLDNCLAYSSSTTCADCAEGYEANVNGKCVSITDPSHCLIKQAGNCTKCLPDYFINTTGGCTKIEDYFTEECENHNVDGTKSKVEIRCNYCKENKLPFNYEDSNTCVSSAIITNKVTDCNKYYAEESNGTTTYKCSLCNGDKVIDSTGVCAAACNLSEASKVMIGFNVNATGSANYDSYSITKNNICVTVSGTDNANCSFLYPDLFNHLEAVNEFSYTCASCNSGYVKYIVKEKATISDDPETNLYGSSPVDVYPGVQCKIETDIKIAALTGLVDNCEYYHNYSDANWSCFKCKFGFHGVVEGAGYIASCVDFSTCEKTTIDSGGLITNKTDFNVLKTSWNAFFSCYQCKGDNIIPFVALDFSVTANFPQIDEFGASPAGAAYNTISGGKSVDCYTISNDSFGINDSANFNFPANCALGVIDVTAVPDATESNIAAPSAGKASVFCIACKPGYKPTRVTNNANLLMVYECTLIPTTECASSTWFNLCSNCAVGHIYKYDPVKKMVMFDTCIPFPDTDCYTADNTDTENVTCVYCKKGFTKNVDGVCERFNAPKCVGNQFNLDLKFNASFANDQHALGMILAPNGSGCHKCEGDYLSLLQTAKEFVCTTSSYLQAGVFPAATNIIANCVNFAADNSTGDFQCKVCAKDYILTTEHKCSLGSDSANCVIAQPDKKCFTCSDEYVNLAGVCEKKNIEKCIEFHQGITVTVQSCLKCEPDYFPSEDKCVKGEMANCIELAAKDDCTTCKEFYKKVVAKNGKSYCYPIADELNCATLNDDIADGNVECTKCKFEYSISTAATAYNETICLDFHIIENCLTYDFTNEIATSTFNCATCTEDFFVGPLFDCQKRTNLHKKCIRFTANADECSVCDEGYFVSEDKTGCDEYPTGVKGCRTYTSKTACENCIENMYLVGNKCLDVEPDARIDECVYYESEKACSLCTQNFAVVEGKCVEAQAKNCKTYDSPTACETCNKEFGFEDENGIRSCVEKQVSKCVESEDFFPFKCITCAKGYYPNDGSCLEVASTIEFCNIYDTKDTCQTCQTGKTLTADQKFCIDEDFVKPLVDLNCKYSYISGQAKCNKCQKGHIMDASGQCIACTQNTFEDGCYVCNPHDQTKCILCSPGFYQTKDFECKATTTQPTEPTDPTDPTEPTDPTDPTTPTENGSIHSITAILMIALLIYR